MDQVKYTKHSQQVTQKTHRAPLLKSDSEQSTPMGASFCQASYALNCLTKADRHPAESQLNSSARGIKRLLRKVAQILIANRLQDTDEDSRRLGVVYQHGLGMQAPILRQATPCPNQQASVLRKETIFRRKKKRSYRTNSSTDCETVPDPLV